MIEAVVDSDHYVETVYDYQVHRNDLTFVNPEYARVGSIPYLVQ